jgi:hypothetical protein
VRLADGKFDETIVDMLEARAKSRLEERRIAAERQGAQELARQRAEAERQEAQELARQRAEAEQQGAKALADSSRKPEAPPPVGTGERVALVIGNGAYRHVPALPNPTRDATDVAALLRRAGFEVMLGTDLDRAGMDDLVYRFAKTAAKAQVAFAFYAGHGVQVGGSNYLIPVDAVIEDDTDLLRLTRLDDVISGTGRAKALAVVAVDACRDDPLAVRMLLAQQQDGPTRSLLRSEAGTGLAAPFSLPPRTLVVYAAAAGRTAADGADRNSPFTEALLRHLGEPEDVRLVFGKVADAVWEASQQRQRPDMWNSLGGEKVFLVRPEAVAQALDAQLTAGERRAIRRSLARLGLFRGPEDEGRFGPALRGAVREFQARQGEPATGFLTVQQTVALHDQARHRGAPEPLPKVDLSDLLERQGDDSPEVRREAQRLMGAVLDEAYETGPLPKHMARAARLYRKAAEAGDVDAALALGRILRDGDGVEADPKEAAGWLRMAADAGRAEAQQALAELYREGRGVPKDPARAVGLLRQAAAGDRGEAIAQLRLLDAW